MNRTLRKNTTGYRQNMSPWSDTWPFRDFLTFSRISYFYNFFLLVFSFVSAWYSAADCRVCRSVSVEAASWRRESTWRHARAGRPLWHARTTVENIQPVRHKPHEDGEEVGKVWRYRTYRWRKRSANSYTHSQYTIHCWERCKLLSQNAEYLMPHSHR